jgi:hypothetical protein
MAIKHTEETNTILEQENTCGASSGKHQNMETRGTQNSSSPHQHFAVCYKLCDQGIWNNCADCVLHCIFDTTW